MEAAEQPLILKTLCSYQLLHLFHLEREASRYFLPKTLLGAARHPQRSALLVSRICLSLAHSHPLLIHSLINLTADSFHHHNNRCLRNLQCSSSAGRVPVFHTGSRGCPWSRSVYLTQLSPKNCSPPTNFTRPRSKCFSCPVPHQNQSAMYRSDLVCQKLPPQGGSEELVRPKRCSLKIGSYAVKGTALGKAYLISQSTQILGLSRVMPPHMFGPLCVWLFPSPFFPSHCYTYACGVCVCLCVYILARSLAPYSSNLPAPRFMSQIYTQHQAFHLYLELVEELGIYVCVVLVLWA